ncbi:hypothetical protein ACFX2G_035887 [Malus domestica]
MKAIVTSSLFLNSQLTIVCFPQVSSFSTAAQIQALPWLQQIQALPRPPRRFPPSIEEAAASSDALDSFLSSVNASPDRSSNHHCRLCYNGLSPRLSPTCSTNPWPPSCRRLPHRLRC